MGTNAQNAQTELVLIAGANQVRSETVARWSCFSAGAAGEIAATGCRRRNYSQL